MASLHDTRMGVQLIQGTMPEIAAALKRIADSLEQSEPSNANGIEMIIESLNKDLPFDTGDPTMEDGGESYWNEQKDSMFEALREDVRELISFRIEALHNGGHSC